jgi:hypothetical protein
MARFRVARLPLLLPLAFAACSTVSLYDEPYSLVQSGVRSIIQKDLPVSINAVDGETTLDPRRSGPLKPGRHVVVAYLNTVVGPYSKQYATLELDAAPCTRYRVVARYENLTHIEWIPVVYPEPIAECRAKFFPTP